MKRRGFLQALIGAPAMVVLPAIKAEPVMIVTASKPVVTLPLAKRGDTIIFRRVLPYTVRSDASWTVQETREHIIYEALKHAK